MNTRGLIAISLSLLLSAQIANGQSFKSKLKKAVKQVTEVVEDATKTQQTNEQTTSTAKSRTTTSTTKSRATTGTTRSGSTTSASRSKTSATTSKPTINLPTQHTALFEPLGYAVDATCGVKTAQPSTPPKDAASQVNWVDKQPYPNTLTNQSLAASFEHLKDLFDDGWFQTLTPAHAYMERISDEFYGRCKVLNDLANGCNEAISMYNDSEEPQWVIDHYNEGIAKTLRSDTYKTLLRSPLAPLFTSKNSTISDDTKKYFSEHGGYQNATKVKMTQWDPSPKETATLSTSGQTGKILSENASGAHIDIDGIEYVVHVGKKSGHAYASQVTKTAVAGKAIVMPDYITYNGGKYPVTSMRANLFEGATIKSIKLPNTLKEISNSAFRNTPITEITIPASVKEIGGSAFQLCKSLTKVVFESDELEKINGCFDSCTALQTVTFPRSVTKGFSYDMFNGCTNLRSVTLPENLTELPKGTFTGCKKLLTVKLPASVTKLGDAFTESGITSIDISHVDEIDDFCFMKCNALKTVKLNSKYKENFVQGMYQYFMQCPLLQVKFANNKYVIPAGFVFVNVE